MLRLTCPRSQRGKTVFFWIKNFTSMRSYIVCFFLLISFLSYAQQGKDSVVVLTLDDCIQTALDRNIQLKRTKNNLLAAESNKFQAIMNYFPSLSAGTNYDFFFGNFFDTNAARQVSETSNSSNPNLSSNMVLFNGFSNHYNLAQRNNELLASKETVKSTEQVVESNILVNYLNVILDLENIQIEKERVELLEAQLEREQKRESVGVGNMESVYNFKSQLANQRLTLNSLEVKYRRDYLTLIQSMQLDITKNDYEIAPYEIDEDELLLDAGSFDEIIQGTLDSNPTIAAAAYSLEASKYSLKAARASRLPTISVFGRIGSNYSSNGARNPETGNFEQEATFWEQLEYNEFEYVNFSINIPLFTRFNTGNQIQQSKVAYANAELGVYEAINDITNLVQTAYLDLVSAQNSYITAKENLEVANQSFEFMKKRFETGNTDFYTYSESLNNKNRAMFELVNAKYNIVFRKKILELYQNQSK